MRCSESDGHKENCGAGWNVAVQVSKTSFIGAELAGLHFARAPTLRMSSTHPSRVKNGLSHEDAETALMPINQV